MVFGALQARDLARRAAILALAEMSRDDALRDALDIFVDQFDRLLLKGLIENFREVGFGSWFPICAGATLPEEKGRAAPCRVEAKPSPSAAHWWNFSCLRMQEPRAARENSCIY